MSKMSILERIRQASKEVVARAEHVRIDIHRIASYAASISDDDLQWPGMDPAHHHLGHGEETAAYILTLESINYGSGYFPVMKKAVKSSGYFTIANKLKKRFEKRGPFSAAALMRLDADSCAKIFGQDRHNVVMRELMRHFALSLNELGRHLTDHYGGSYVKLVESANGSAEDLVEKVAAMSRFDDVAFYRDLDVVFYKRAQLTAAAMYIAFDGAGLGQLEGLDRLTAFADNQVPHVLRVDGVLRYSPALAEHIDAGRLVPPQSPEEVEIRASCIHVVELLVTALQQAGRNTNALALDQYLWNRGLGSGYRSLPTHRTRTIFY